MTSEMQFFEPILPVQVKTPKDSIYLKQLLGRILNYFNG